MAKGKGGGRKSKAAFDLEAETGQAITVHQRQAVPLALAGAAEELWRDIVQTMPADWLDVASAPLLEAYVVHLTRARRIAGELEAFEAARDLALEAMAAGGEHVPLETEEWSRLTNLYRRETVAMANLATRLRIAPSSRYNADWRPSKGGIGTRKKPWEFEG